MNSGARSYTCSMCRIDVDMFHEHQSLLENLSTLTSECDSEGWKEKMPAEEFHQVKSLTA